MKVLSISLVVFLLLAPTLTASGEGPESIVLDAGPLKLKVHISRTAHLFHVVDQLSEWSQFCHKQYGRHMTGLTDRDRELLAKHAAVREQRPWGEGLEQTFYTSLDLETALKQGISNNWLTAEQAEVEREVLLHFAPRIDRLMKEEMETLKAFRQQLQKELPHLRDFSEKLARFYQGAPPAIPMFIIANPDEQSCGGGYNGERLTLEIPRARNVYPTFLHETMHAFIRVQESKLHEAVKHVDGLDYMTLNEGIAYALAPGILHSETDGPDPLLRRVSNDMEQKKPLTDAFTCFNRFGLALRPLLKEALEDDAQTLESFLPRAVDAWRVLRELDAAGNVELKPKVDHRYRGSHSSPSVFIMTPSSGSKPLFDAACQSVADGVNRYGRPHGKKHYDEMFADFTKPGDTMLLLFTLDRDDRIPPEYEDLLPKPWSEIEALLKQGETVSLTGHARKLEIILMAAPTTVQLKDLIQQSEPLKSE
ncbi:MAG: hypothetical protein JXQ75_19625 [Phycisphaerae bacterium]|nr:hypothetical protein [Phycisphaerae bacterium]